MAGTKKTTTPKKARKARIARKTTETDITLELGVDGSGRADASTGIPFFDHMLCNFARHGLFDLKVRAKGDLDVDYHHTVEDVGLCLGEALKKALGDKTGITRCATSSVPMMDALSTVVVDISARPYLRLNIAKGAAAAAKKVYSAKREGIITDTFDMALVEEFMKALSNSAGLDLHITLEYGRDIHHSIESIFKALGRALSAAAAKDARIRGVLSTKGSL